MTVFFRWMSWVQPVVDFHRLRTLAFFPPIFPRISTGFLQFHDEFAKGFQFLVQLMVSVELSLYDAI